MTAVDETEDATAIDNITTVASENLCIEDWVIAMTVNSVDQYGRACVRYQGTVSRLFDTSDTENDMILELIPYNVRVRFGPSPENESNNIY